MSRPSAWPSWSCPTLPTARPGPASSSRRSPGWSSGSNAWPNAPPTWHPGGGSASSGCVLLVVVLALFVRWRIGPVSRSAGLTFTVDPETSAAQYRTHADELAAAGQWDGAVSERMRALVRASQERGLIDAHPGWTADEVATEVGQRVPGARAALDAAARTFDEVRYGGRPGSPAAYGAIAAADDLVAAASAVGAGAPRRRRAGARSAARRDAGRGPMSAPAGTQAPSPAPTTFDDTAWDRARHWRPSRRGLAIAALLLLALVVLMVTTSRRTGYLDPAAVDPSGSRAVANVLGDQGVRVTDVAPDGGRRSQRSGRDGPGHQLDAAHLRDDHRGPRLGPRPHGPRRPAPRGPRRSSGWRPARSSPTLPGTAPSNRDAGGGTPCAPGAPSCPGPATTPVPGSPRGQACYDSPESAALLVIPARAGRPEVVVLGSAHPLTNEGFATQGNASLALSVLGSRSDLVWWRPVPSDPALAGQAGATLRELLPVWVVPVLIAGPGRVRRGRLVALTPARPPGGRAPARGHPVG